MSLPNINKSWEIDIVESIIKSTDSEKLLSINIDTRLHFCLHV